eukprot:CAMPEP_0173412472 /NCGR_PEP_ID=MMETSP1356-20130122/79595_1 /TAXON_ID=77927 ORGANISM="Hemiselmis virescens, Strain PCC157" /NCGR_SAMPLE_ID=MMETSP1356 /ASSEMBLY_ACC=CAM_ASM_000847 /LENGTH=47 /DNA_ID= /DNA_START= /DNA_END= /DNA_ORIENTATION=
MVSGRDRAESAPLGYTQCRTDPQVPGCDEWHRHMPKITRCLTQMVAP